MGDLANSSEKIKSSLRELQVQNETRLVHVKARLEARISQFES